MFKYTVFNLKIKIPVTKRIVKILKQILSSSTLRNVMEIHTMNVYLDMNQYQLSIKVIEVNYNDVSFQKLEQ